MKAHRPEVADIFRQHEQEFLERWRSVLSDRQLQTLRDIGACRTAALGAHLHVCNRCHRETIVPNSCLNRHCPKCGSMARDRWEKHSEELLPTAYSHVIFTLPHELIPLVLQNPTVVYNIFFRAVSQALLIIGSDPRHLGARLGFLAVLHTWNQKLLAHPHIHCLVPAGGIALDQTRWISCRHPKFFLPVKALGAKFRGKFLALLRRRVFRRGMLQFRGTVARLQTRQEFDRFTWLLKNKDWVVYAKKPFAGPTHVIRYLAHYTHRVAISNGRLLRFENGQVSFRWRDSAHGNKQKVMTLDAVEFVRRFLLHVLPRGFVKIRHFGFLANRERRRALSFCFTLLSSSQPVTRADSSRPREVRLCPYCQGTLVLIKRLTAVQVQARHPIPALDTS